MNIDETTYQRIYNLCKKDGISCAELLRNVGLSKSTLTELKMGRSKSLSSVANQKIADYFGVSVDYIMNGTDSESARDTDGDLKVALFGGDGEVTEEMWQEVLEFAEFVKKKRTEKKK